MDIFETITLNSAPTIYRCEPAWCWNAVLPDHDFWCVLKGIGSIRVNQREYPLRPGSVWVLAPGDRVEARQNAKDRLHVFAVHFDLSNRAGQTVTLEAGDRPSAGFITGDLNLLSTLSQACVRAAADRHSTSSGALRARLLVRLMLLALRDESREPVCAGDPKIEAVANRICEDPAAGWTVSGLAAAAGLSRSQFTRRFQGRMNTAPNRFIIQARITRAGQLLRDTDMTVGAIAEMLGYTDMYQFSRQFKAKTGHTPTRYRHGTR